MGSEKKFPKSLQIFALKGKLELMTGCKCETMKIEAFDKNNKLICRLDNDEALLGSYPIDDGMRLHITDPARVVGEFEDVSKVEKFTLSEEEYSKREDSVRAFKQRMKLGRFADVDPEEKRRQEEELRRAEQEEADMLAKIRVGDRCAVRMPEQPERRGTVRYVGRVEFQAGDWVGVQYDEPVGKNDGSVKGTRYFECQPKYGGFVKVQYLEVGDFPEEGFDELEEL